MGTPAGFGAGISWSRTSAPAALRIVIRTAGAARLGALARTKARRYPARPRTSGRVPSGFCIPWVTCNLSMVTVSALAPSTRVKAWSEVASPPAVTTRTLPPGQPAGSSTRNSWSLGKRTRGAGVPPMVTDWTGARLRPFTRMGVPAGPDSGSRPWITGFPLITWKGRLVRSSRPSGRARARGPDRGFWKADGMKMATRSASQGTLRQVRPPSVALWRVPTPGPLRNTRCPGGPDSGSKDVMAGAAAAPSVTVNVRPVL